jgi:signal transduction histidine kinase
MRSCSALLLALLFAPSARAATVTLDPARAHYDVADAAELLEDPSGNATVDEVARPPLSDRFVPLTAERRNVGFSRSAFFLRVTLVNPGPTPLRWYVEPSRASNDTRLYAPADGGGFAEQRTGAGLTLYERALFLPGLFFPLTLPPGKATTIYLREQTSNHVRLSLDLVGDNAIVRRLAQDWSLIGLFYGAMVALLLYNLFMLGSVGDRAYLYYSIFQLGLICVQLSDDDLGHTFLWPHAPRWRHWSESFFMMVAIVGSIGFARSFLELGSLWPWLDRVARWMQRWALALALACPLSSTMLYQKLALGWMPLWCALMTAGAWVAWRRGNPNARYFAAGWSVLLLASVAVPLSRFGLANATNALALADVIVKAGALAEALLLSFGLANRINFMRREKAAIAAELLASRTAQAQALERRVEERTRELTSTLETLRKTQARMIQQARLASLGHLAAGVAHEIANPLNFMNGGARELGKRLDEIEGALAAAAPDATARAQAAAAQARRATALVASGNERIRRIVDHVRDFLAARPGTLEPTDLVATVESTLAMMEQQLAAQSIQVTRALATVPLIPSRPGELGQVLVNLLVNSCQAMSAGGELRLETRCHDGWAELWVSDTGPGIAPEHRDAIFDPFFTTRAPAQGTGLGLSISYEIVRRHGGQLELVDSARGATFVLRLPLTAPAAAAPS